MPTHHHTPALDDLDADPNLYPEPLNEEQHAATAVTCRFLGRVFYEGDTICYQGGVWLCQSGGWAETGDPC